MVGDPGATPRLLLRRVGETGILISLFQLVVRSWRDRQVPVEEEVPAGLGRSSVRVGVSTAGRLCW